MTLINNINLREPDYEEDIAVNGLPASLCHVAEKTFSKNCSSSPMNAYIFKVQKEAEVKSWDKILEENFPQNTDEIYTMAGNLQAMGLDALQGMLETFAIYKLQERSPAEFIKVNSDHAIPFTIIAQGGSCYINLKEKIGKALGKGNYKRAFQAIYINGGHIEKVAHKKVIKCIAPSKNAAQVQEAKKEAETQKLFNHSSIVKIYTSFEYGAEGLAIYEELCEGTLHDLIDKNLIIPYTEKISFFQNIASGLSHIHKKGYAHNDLKLDNIFLKGRSAKIGDFGLCTPFGTVNRAVFKKTMPPEYLRIKNRLSSAKTDCYQFGLMLWQVFHPNLSDEHLLDSFVFPPIDELFQDWPQQSSQDHAIQRLIKKCLAKNSDERISMEEIESELIKIKALA